MSKEPKTNVMTNDEVTDDLTRNLESSLRPNPEEFVINPGTSEEKPVGAGDTAKSGKVPDVPNPLATDLDKDFDEKEADSDFDTIDESSLKDAEVDLTDDEKAERKIIAEDLKSVGNDAFKIGDFERSIEKYTEGLRICPLQFSQQRAVLYCNRSAAKTKLEKYDKAIKDCTKAIELDDKYLKAYTRRAISYELTDKLDESLADYQKILELDPSHKDAEKAVHRLKPLIEAKNEKLKAEMLGKLKDLGNMILKPFGLSTENFHLEQDPESKGYKINFKQ